MNENLLNPQEIEFILKRSNSVFLNLPGVISKFTKQHVDILCLTPNKKLIFIEGNTCTGFKHIRHRHGFFSNSYSPDGGQFIRSSRFNINSETFFEYQRIAELIYDEKNIDSKNKFPELFDVFIAKVDKRKYRLILYKGTKIVHTLFPIESNKSYRRFRKGEIIVTRIGFEIYLGIIPYYDIDDIVRYAVEITFLPQNNLEKWTLVVYKDNLPFKQTDLKDFNIEYKYGIKSRFEQLNYVNMSQIENLISELENSIT